MSKSSRRRKGYINLEIDRTRAKLIERRRLIEVLNRYLKQDEQKLEELISSGRF